MVGWRYDQLLKATSSEFGWTALVIFGIWMCTVWWIQNTRDISTAMAFGQLLAASVSLAFLIIKR
jgi:hypothetical protein